MGRAALNTTTRFTRVLPCAGKESLIHVVRSFLAAAACTKPGALGALLRREGLYSSHLAVWRAARRRGDLQGPATRRGPLRSTPDPARQQIAELEHTPANATACAERVECIIGARTASST